MKHPSFLLASLLALSACATTPPENCEPALRGASNWHAVKPPDMSKEIIKSSTAPAKLRYLWYANDSGKLRACLRDTCGTSVYEFERTGGIWIGELVVLTVCRK